MSSAPRLTDRKIEKVVQVLDGWSGKLTWAHLLAILEVDLGHKYSKVAMLKKRRIRDAWDLAKKRTRTKSEGVGHGDVAMGVARKRIDQLEAEAARLKRENNVLLEQFKRWAHNAALHGMTPRELDRPLPNSKA